MFLRFYFFSNSFMEKLLKNNKYKYRIKITKINREVKIQNKNKENYYPYLISICIEQINKINKKKGQ